MSFTFVLLLSGMFTISLSNSQTCHNGKVWAFRYSHCEYECKCVIANPIQNWIASHHLCINNGLSGNPHCPYCNFQNAENEFLETSLRTISIKPVSGSAIISFSPNLSQKVSM
jgi:hypothetical protein